MTDKFIVSDYFANRLIQRSIQPFTIENIEFELMALDKGMVEAVKLCSTYEDMLFLAANGGLSYERSRVIDDENLTEEDIDALWGDELKDVDSDPCIRYRVGEKVCEISGLQDTIEEMLALEAEVAREEEEAVLIKVGDHELAGSTLIDNLNQESLDADAAEYVSAV